MKKEIFLLNAYGNFLQSYSLFKLIYIFKKRLQELILTPQFFKHCKENPIISLNILQMQFTAHVNINYQRITLCKLLSWQIPGKWLKRSVFAVHSNNKLYTITTTTTIITATTAKPATSFISSTAHQNGSNKYHQAQLHLWPKSGNIYLPTVRREGLRAAAEEKREGLLKSLVSVGAGLMKSALS